MKPPRILIVGAGIVGASIAWHCMQDGAEVTIIDAGHGGGVATRHSFAWINASWGNPERYFQFRRRSMRGWHDIDRAVPGIALDRCGSLLWDLPEAELETYVRQHASWGYGIRIVGRAEIATLEPGIRAPPEMAAHVAEECMVEPVAATQALLQAAVAGGARIVTGARVAALSVRSGTVTGAVTVSGEPIDADETVVAAGTETATLLASAGTSLSMTAPPGLLAHSAPLPVRLLKGMVMAPNCHVRQSLEGRLIVGADFAGGDPGANADAKAGALIAEAKSMIAGTDDLVLGYATVGYRPTPVDGLPAIGRRGGFPGLYVAVMHSGVTLAPLVGQLVARELIAGRRDPDLNPYAPDRPELA